MENQTIRRPSVLDGLVGSTKASEKSSVADKPGDAEGGMAGELDTRNPADIFKRLAVAPASGDDDGGTGDDDGGDYGYDDAPRNDGRNSAGSAPGSGSRNYSGAKRGPKPGSARKKENINLTNKLLFGIHSALATGFKQPVWLISETESQTLAEAIQNVADQYDIVIDPKTEAWLQLGMALSGVYGPRIAVTVMAQQNKAKQQAPAPVQQEQQRASVVPIRREEKKQDSAAFVDPMTKAKGIAEGFRNPSELFGAGGAGASESGFDG